MHNIGFLIRPLHACNVYGDSYTDKQIEVVDDMDTWPNS